MCEMVSINFTVLCTDIEGGFVSPWLLIMSWYKFSIFFYFLSYNILKQRLFPTLKDFMLLVKYSGIQFNFMIQSIGWNQDLQVAAYEQFLLPLNRVFILFLNKVKTQVKSILVLLN